MTIRRDLAILPPGRRQPRRYGVGRDEAVIREYIKKQEREDTRLDQLALWR
jgi:hypothetical protein